MTLNGDLFRQKSQFSGTESYKPYLQKSLEKRAYGRKNTKSVVKGEKE